MRYGRLLTHNLMTNSTNRKVDFAGTCQDLAKCGAEASREVVLHRSLYVFLFAALSVDGAGLSNNFAMLFAKGFGDRRQATGAPGQH